MRILITPLRVGVATLAFGASALRASAQEPDLPSALAPAARVTLQRLIDSVATLGVPRKPLVDKAAEGVLKGAQPDRIVRAVETLAGELETARAALDGTNDLSALGAAAGALHAGVSRSDLRRLAHPPGPGPNMELLANALVTLVDLVAKRVPLDVATSSIQAMIDRRAPEQQFTTLRNDVARDVLAGRSPEASLTARMRAQIGGVP
jgi:hypothetical protein